MGARAIGSRASEAFGNAHGTIIHAVEIAPDVYEYGVAWDDGEYADETWTEQDLLPLEDSND